MGSVNSIESKKRLNEVANMLLEGKSTKDIISHAAYHWKISERATFKYISKAYKQFGKSAAFNRDEQLGLAIKRLERLYHEAFTDGQLRTALHVVKELNQILGLRIEKTEATVTVLTKEEAKQKFDELLGVSES